EKQASRLAPSFHYCASRPGRARERGKGEAGLKE
ncbi:hypothetical protein Ccrd_025363, partial [Cynara cardunculus var. scolymus]